MGTVDRSVALFARSMNVLFNVAEKIYLSGLYVYAAEGVLPMPFDKETLDTAWIVKKQKSPGKARGQGGQ